MREKINDWILNRIADTIIKFLDRGGFTIVNRNDAALLFREGANESEFVFPWHMRPSDEDLKEDPHAEMPAHLVAASIFGFVLRKAWLMKFIAFYSTNEKEVEANFGHLQEIMDGLQHQHTPVMPARTGEIVH